MELFTITETQTQAETDAQIPLRVFQEWLRAEDWLSYISIEEAAERFKESYVGKFRSVCEWAKWDMQTRYPSIFKLIYTPELQEIFWKSHADMYLGETIWSIELDQETHIFNMYF